MMTMGEPCADEQSSWWDAVQGLCGVQHYDSASQQDAFALDPLQDVNELFQAADVLGMLDTHPPPKVRFLPQPTPVPAGTCLTSFRRYMKSTFQQEREQLWELYDAYTEPLEATLPALDRIDGMLKRGREVDFFISFDEWKSATAEELERYQQYIVEERGPHDVREFAEWQCKN